MKRLGTFAGTEEKEEVGMSLNWDLSKVKGADKLCWDENEKMRNLTNALIWSSMAIGLREIKADNIQEWRFRLAFLNKLDRGIIVTADGAYLPTVEEISSHIGLSTNVMNQGRKTFMHRMADSVGTSVAHDLRQRAKESSTI